MGPHNAGKPIFTVKYFWRFHRRTSLLFICLSQQLQRGVLQEPPGLAVMLIILVTPLFIVSPLRILRTDGVMPTNC